MLNLTSYMDEAGHSDDPSLEYVGMAGFVAPRGAWEIFNQHWQDILDKEGLKEPFHMVEFAQSRGQFEDWKRKEDKRKLLFGRLMQIITETQATPIGGIISVKDFRSLTPSQQTSFLDPYYVAFQTCTRGAAIEAIFKPPEEKVRMVYAFQSEFGGRADQLWYAIKEHYEHGNRMGSYVASTPSQEPPLQAADIFAYELLKEFENRVKRPNDKMRWGLQKILRMEKTPLPRICLFDRKELLRRVRESNFEDQTCTEEADRNQMLSAMEQMMKWVIERGSISYGDVDF